MAERKRVLVIGGSGYLGQHLLDGLANAGGDSPYDLAFTHHSPIPPPELIDAISPVLSFCLDLRTGEGFESISNTFGKPHIVVNCAALSVPRACEVDPVAAMAINLPSSLVNWLSSFRDKDILLIHLSTDQVYDGSKSFYKEEDETAPVNMYGRSKVAAELFISEHWSNFAILRSSIIYGPQTISPVSKSLPVQVKDSDFLFALLDGVIEEIGEHLVVQVVTDNASAYKAAGQKLMEKRKHMYWNKEGFFGLQQAKDTITKRSPVEWWIQFGDGTPELQRFAIKVLGLTCSSSACERNWSTYNQIHTKRRNRLSTLRMNSLAYIMYNKKLKDRSLKKKAMNDGEDPLLCEDIPSDDEWFIDDENDVTTPEFHQEDLNVDFFTTERQRPTTSSDPKQKGKRKNIEIEEEEEDWEALESFEPEDEGIEAGQTHIDTDEDPLNFDDLL